MLSYVKLAVGNGGATNQTAALANTWAQFSTGSGPTNANGGPAHVETWDGRRMSYYTGGFNDAAIGAVELVRNLGRHYTLDTYTSVPSTSGQCGSFASLLQSALALNGVSSIWVDIRNVNAVLAPPVLVKMVIKNWTFGSPGYPLEPFWKYKFLLNTTGDYMLNPNNTARTAFADLANVGGAPGQNEQTVLPGVPSATPLEKVFDAHFIVRVPIASGNQYYDPSYGVTYASYGGFETQAVEGYAYQFPPGHPSEDPEGQYHLFRPVPGNPQIGFQEVGALSMPTF